MMQTGKAVRYYVEKAGPVEATTLSLNRQFGWSGDSPQTNSQIRSFGAVCSADHTYAQAVRGPNTTFSGKKSSASIPQRDGPESEK